MKSKILRICTAIIFSIPVILGLSFSGCKKFGVPDYELSITFEDGVQGLPINGTYSHEELSVIEYSYTPLNDEHTVEVLVNGNRWASEGSFTMYTDMDVLVRIFDLRGTWNFTLTASDTDVDDRELEITFSGGSLLSGNFSDDQGNSGIWDINGDTLTMTYGDWQDYILTGSVTTMSGDWTGDSLDGTWGAVRLDEE